MLSSQIGLPDDIAHILASEDGALAYSISGGEDSSAMVLGTEAMLRDRGLNPPRILLHAHLGDIEWPQTMPALQQLSAFTGLELVIVRRSAGGLIDR